MASSTKVGSTWKSINGIKVKVGSQWKTATAAYVKVNGVWKQWASALPDLVGSSATSATSTLTALGISVVNNNSSSSNSAYSGYDGGYVYSQSPASGSLIGPGDTVTLTSFTYSGGGGGTPTPTPTQDSSVSYLSPSSAAAGTQLTIYGSFPSPITNISFNGTNITYGSWSQTSTQITCTIPSGSGTVSVQVYNGKTPLLSGLSFTYGTGGTVPTPTPTPSPTATTSSAPVKISNPSMSGSGTTVTATGGIWSQTPVYVTFDFYKNGAWTGTTYTSNVWLGQSNSYSITGDAGGVYTVIAYSAFDFSGTSYGASSNNSYTVPSGGGTPTPTPTPSPTATAVTCSGTNCNLASCQTCDSNLSYTGTRSVSTSICASGTMNTYTCYTPGSCSNITSDTGCVAAPTWYCTTSSQCGGVGNCSYNTSSTNDSATGTGYNITCSQSGYPGCQSTSCGPTPTPTPTPAPTLNCSTCTYGTATYSCNAGYTGSRTVCITSVGCADYDLSNTCTPVSPSPTPTPTPAPTCVSNQGSYCGRYGNGTVQCDGTCAGDRCC